MEMAAVDITFFLRGLLGDSPMLVVWFAGLIIAMVKPIPAFARVCAFLACGLELTQSVLGNWYFYVLTRDGRMSLQDIDEINIVRHVLDAAAWCLVLCAVFAWRQQSPHLTFSRVDEPSKYGDVPPGAFRR